MAEKREMRDAMIFLQQYGISNTLAVKIFNKYGSRIYNIIKENPYQLADDISGIGFKTADEIAAKVRAHYGLEGGVEEKAEEAPATAKKSKASKTEEA